MLDDGFKVRGLDKAGTLHGESEFIIIEYGESLDEEC